MNENEFKALREARERGRKERLKRKLIGWPLAILAVVISFLLSAFARYGYEQLTGAPEDSIISLVIGMVVFFISGYFFVQHFRDFWGRHLH